MKQLAYLLIVFVFVGYADIAAQTTNDCSNERIAELWMKTGEYVHASEVRKSIVELKKIRTCAKEIGNDYNCAAPLVYISLFKLELLEYDSSIYYLDVLRGELGNLEIEQDSLYGIIADMYYFYGFNYYQRGMFEQTIAYYQLAINTLLEQVGYYSTNKIDYGKLGHNFSAGAIDLFNNAAMTYSKFGDYDKSIEYFDIAIELLELKAGKAYDKESQSMIIQNQAMCFIEKGDYERAGSNLSKVIKLMEYLPKREKSMALIYKNMALYYQGMGKKDSTEYYINKALSLRTTPKNKIIIHQKASEIYLDAGNYPLAKTNLDSANIIIDSLYGFFHPEMAMNYAGYSKIKIKEKKYQESNALLNKALNILMNKDSEECDCNELEVGNVIDKRTALKITEQKAKNLLSIDGNKALECYELVSVLIQELQQKVIISEESKYSLANNSKLIYEAALEAAAHMDDQSKGYLFSQKSRGAILLEQIQNKSAIKASSIPLENIQLLEELKRDINTFQKEKETALKNGDAGKKKEWEDRLFAKERAYEQEILKIEKDYPQYYNLKYNIPSIPIKQIQQTLNSQSSTLIEYFLGEEHLYIFVIDGTDIQVDKIKIEQQLFDDISTLNECISTADYSYTTFRKFNESSHRLYNTLLKNAIDKGWIDNRNLIIIPDEQLNLIPFEALVTKQQEFNDTFPHYHQLDYLVMDYDISYHYSSNLLQGKSKGKDRDKKSFLGIAPTFTGRNIQKLENNISEIQNAASHYPDSEILQSDNANYQNILESIGDYKTVHFATHAIFNDEIPLDSRIELADTSLYIYEIFGMEHNLDLAIMSACETASGKRRKGEGVISLSRAFIQSGCPSVIASLWSISDQKTSMLMKNFYEYFSKGKTAKASLSEAKRKYISEAMSKNVHPFYWAGFIQVGTVDVENGGIPFYYWFIGGVILILLAVYILRKKK